MNLFDWKDRLFDKILKVYPSINATYDRNHKWKLADAILNLPVDDIYVTTICPECDGKGFFIHNGFTGDFDSNGQPIVDEELKGQVVSCTLCNKEGNYEQPLTVGEVLEMLPKMVEVLNRLLCLTSINYAPNKEEIKYTLITKKGRIVGGKSEIPK